MSVAVDNRGVFGELVFNRAGVFNQARVAPSKPAKVGYSEAKGSFDKAALIVQYHTLLKDKPYYQRIKPYIELMVDVAPFIQGASMSLGSLSPQAHELVAEIFNSLGMISKTGEGGESPVVNHPHAMAQMGSALFGVTNEFLHKAALEHKYA